MSKSEVSIDGEILNVSMSEVGKKFNKLSSSFADGEEVGVQNPDDGIEEKLKLPNKSLTFWEESKLNSLSASICFFSLSTLDDVDESILIVFDAISLKF